MHITYCLLLAQWNIESGMRENIHKFGEYCTLYTIHNIQQQPMYLVDCSSGVYNIQAFINDDRHAYKMFDCTQTR